MKPAELYATKSRPFDRPETGKIAVKVLNPYGNEVLKGFGVGCHESTWLSSSGVTFQRHNR